jgi:hypothetical protein
MLWDGDRQAQPREQLIMDCEWADPGRTHSIRQHLACSLAQTLGVDPSGGFEQIIKAYSVVFSGKIIVQNTDEALKQAWKSRGGLTL